jgi:carboxyl-terminal processing protease
MKEFGNDLLIAQLKSFMFDEGAANHLISSARKHNVLILDVRQNPGGSVDTLKGVLGGLFDHDVKIADRVGRDNTKAMVAKTNHHPFEGKIIVLIDSKSASASELLARVMQLEKRGTVIGDRSSGSVMEAREYAYPVGMALVSLYGASITDANLIMSDGKSLEHDGVTPDEAVLPTPEDLARGRDPVLARAAELAGVKLTAEEASKLFPYEWPKD